MRLGATTTTAKARRGSNIRWTSLFLKVVGISVFVILGVGVNVSTSSLSFHSDNVASSCFDPSKAFQANNNVAAKAEEFGNAPMTTRSISITLNQAKNITTGSSSGRRKYIRKFDFQKEPPVMVETSNSKANTNTNTNQSQSFAVFYNLYVPPAFEKGTQGVVRALSIAEEQLDYLGNSTLLTANGKVTVYYNLIGHNNSLSSPPQVRAKIATTISAEIDKMCRPRKLKCVMMDHYKANSGYYEEVTLTQLHQFCQAYPDFRVLYMHSKGTYNDIEEPAFSQSTWRKHMMTAITHNDCLQPPIVGDGSQQCDVCGMLLNWVPTLHFMGNFFTASCSYVQKLLEPVEFEQRLEQVVREAMMMRLDFIFVANVAFDANYHYGLGRFASEHWLGSHPSVKACEMATDWNLFNWRTQEVRNTSVVGSPDEYKFAMFPRRPINGGAGGWTYIKKHVFKTSVMKNQKDRRRDWFLLPGLLYKWYELYGEPPPDDSWVWEFYPDGKYWKKLTKQFGKGAVIEGTKEYATPPQT